MAFESVSALTCCSLLLRHNHHRAVQCSSQCDHRLLMGLVYDSCVSTDYGPNGLPASSNIFQRFALPSSISKHELERQWCFIEGWHVCAFVCVCVVVLFYVANHLHCFAVCTAWPFIQRLHSVSLFLQRLQILSEGGGWSVDLTFAGNSCCNSCWVLRWCGLFASETYMM